MYNRLDTMPACDRQTDRQTDRETDGQTSCHGIVLATHARRAVKIGDRMVEAPITRRGRRREEGNGKEFLPPRPTPWSGGES